MRLAADVTPPISPVVVSVQVRLEVKVLHTTQWNALFAPALAGL